MSLTTGAIVVAVLAVIGYALTRGTVVTGSEERLPPLPSDETRRVLATNIGKRLRITFTDGVTQSVDVDWVDDEGFGHSGPDGEKPRSFWSQFESVASIQTT